MVGKELREDLVCPPAGSTELTLLFTKESQYLQFSYTPAKLSAEGPPMLKVYLGLI